MQILLLSICELRETRRKKAVLFLMRVTEDSLARVS